MESISYKGFFKGESGQPDEVRRFTTDKETLPALVTLQKKVEQVFYVLQDKKYTITWEDDDGDRVTISSDEELQIALTEMAGPVYKLHFAFSASDKAANNAEASSPNAEQLMQGEVHPGVTCDGCDGQVRGHRYKCMICPDYDLCARCEVKGIHPGHNMMRLATVQGTWPHNFFKRLQKMQERAVKRQMGREKAEPEEEPAEDDSKGNATSQPNGCGQRRPLMTKCHWGGRRGPLTELPTGPLGAMMQGWMGTGCPGQNAAPAPDQANQAFLNHNAIHEAAMARAAKEMENNGVNLQSLGEHVRQVLDPFGVDVDILVEKPTAKTTSTSCSRSSSASNVTKEANKSMDDKDIPKKPMDAAKKPMVDGDETSPQKDAVQATPDSGVTMEKATSVTVDRASASPSPKIDEEWTVINDGAKPSTSNNANSTLYADEKGRIYPQLPDEDVKKPAKEGAAAAAASSKDQSPHPDQKIEVALQAMMNMGFSNEGGWLTGLLEAKQGDIGKVLDILQPVRK